MGLPKLFLPKTNRPIKTNLLPIDLSNKWGKYPWHLFPLQGESNKKYNALKTIDWFLVETLGEVHLWFLMLICDCIYRVSLQELRLYVYGVYWSYFNSGNLYRSSFALELGNAHIIWKTIKFLVWLRKKIIIISFERTELWRSKAAKHQRQILNTHNWYL